MYRLLIVDDEPLIVDGLYEFFVNRLGTQVEVVKALSAKEALNILNEMKIDVVLSDIYMPEMDGLEFLEYIAEGWPRCRVIFLTGHDVFTYAHRAIRSPIVTDYLLKTEDMDLIGESVERGFALVKEELAKYNEAHWHQTTLKNAIPQLQKQLITDIFHGWNKDSIEDLPVIFKSIELPFAVEQPVFISLLTVEEWGKYTTERDRSLLRYAVCNIAEELIGTNIHIKCVQLDQSSIGCLIQPHAVRMPDNERKHLQTFRFISSALETVQQACDDHLKITVSIAISENFVMIDNLSEHMNRLRLAMMDGPSKGMEKWMVVDTKNKESVLSSDLSSVMAAEFQLDQMLQFLLQANKIEWAKYFRRFQETACLEGLSDSFNKLLIINAISKHILSCLQGLGLKEQAIVEIDLSKLLRFSAQSNWKEIMVYFQQVMEWVFEKRLEHLNCEESRFINILHSYIHNHLDGDLSLTRISREVFLNPSYLSRWYKRINGRGISDYIQETKLEKSKELLLSTTLRIHEISNKLGFADQHYFFRFFKKAVGYTPHEYRELMSRKLNTNYTK